jgi:GT2 family glycosyltransferase
MPKRVAISIVNYIRVEDTIRCIKSLLAAEACSQREYVIEIWVVDNYSSEACRIKLKSVFKEEENVYLIFLSTNVGFAGGHNKSLVEIIGRDFDFIWLLNSDCVIDKKAIGAHIRASELEPEVSIWGSTLFERDGKSIQCAGGCFYSPWLSIFKQYGYAQDINKLLLKPVPKFDYVAGASMFFPFSTIEQLIAQQNNVECESKAFLNEVYFLYFEELDLAWRLGEKAVFGWCKDAKVVHFGGSSTGVEQGKSSAVAEYHSTLSSLKYTWLYHRSKLWSVAPFRLIAKLVQLLFKMQPLLFLQTLRAYIDFLKWVMNESSSFLSNSH